MDIARFLQYRNRVQANCSKVIVGKDDVIELVLTAFICGGHVLLEDVPGTGKTMLLRAFARTVGGDPGYLPAGPLRHAGRQER